MSQSAFFFFFIVLTLPACRIIMCVWRILFAPNIGWEENTGKGKYTGATTGQKKQKSVEATQHTEYG